MKLTININPELSELVNNRIEKLGISRDEYFNTAAQYFLIMTKEGIPTADSIMEFNWRKK